MLVNKEKKRAFKRMHEHVNMMDKSMKHHIIVDHIGDDNKQVLADFLKHHNPQMWDLSSDELKQQLIVSSL